MLYERFGGDVTRILLPRERYRPYPPAADRAAWEDLPDAVRSGRTAAGEAFLGCEWPGLPATLFMEYRRDGNRSRYERNHFARRRALSALVTAECVEGKGRFCDDIANGVWALCEESFWGVPAHNGARRFPGAALPDTSEPIIDLFAAETGGLLAWTHYLLAQALDTVSPLVADRIRREVKARIIDPFLTRDDFWWMAMDEETVRTRGVNNWNPWCHSNCLSAALLLEESPERRVAFVTKTLRGLDRFLDSYHADGGCDEGTSYWGRAGGSLFDCLELLHGATNGAIDIYGEPFVQNIGRYLYRAFISGEWYVNFADGGARVRIADDLVYRYGRRIGDEKLMALGSSAFHRRAADQSGGGVPDAPLRTLPALFDDREIDAATPDPPFIREAWLDGIEVMTAREREGSDRGLYLAAKGGHNKESHNHNDVGQFIVFYDGQPVLIDVGVETYTSRTFGPNRYDIWTMQSAYHNLPTVGGVQQAPGRAFAARDVACEQNDERSELALDLAGAYPAEAGIVTWRRTMSLERVPLPRVVIRDMFRLERAATGVTLSLMTPRPPDCGTPGRIVLPGESDVTVTWEGETFDVSSEQIEITDDRLRPVWGDYLYRILLKTRALISDGDWTLRIEAAGQ